MFTLEPCPNDPRRDPIYVNPNSSGTQHEITFAKSRDKTKWEDFLRPKTGAAFTSDNWKLWHLNLISRTAPYFPARLFRNYMMEAILNGYEDNDRVPVILRGFDRAMLTHFVDNCGDQLSTKLHNKIRANTVKGATEMTGKQALSIALEAFGKSHDNIVKEAYLSLGSFTVPENADPVAWANAVDDYDLRIYMASDGRDENEEKMRQYCWRRW